MLESLFLRDLNKRLGKGFTGISLIQRRRIQEKEALPKCSIVFSRMNSPKTISPKVRSSPFHSHCSIFFADAHFDDFIILLVVNVLYDCTYCSFNNFILCFVCCQHSVMLNMIPKYQIIPHIMYPCYILNLSRRFDIYTILPS